MCEKAIGSNTMKKSNGPNSISKDTLRDEDCPWLINCTTQEYLVNVGLDSHFNKHSRDIHLFQFYIYGVTENSESMFVHQQLAGVTIRKALKSHFSYN